MKRLFVRIILTALVFYYLLPMINGIHVHGSFINALGLAVFFPIMLWAVEKLAIAISAVLGIATLGLALVVIIPFWILGFWLLPAIALKIMSDIMPGYLSFDGWWPAILAGLVLMILGVLTGGITQVKKIYVRG